MKGQNNDNSREEQITRTFNPNDHLLQIKNRNGSADYLPVQWRLVWFREHCPEGSIETEMLQLDLDRETEEEGYAWNNDTRRSEKVIKRANGLAVFRATVKDGKGGIATALPLLGDAPFLLVNADIYCEVPFGPLLTHRLGGMLAHLVLVPNPAHRPKGDFSLAGGRIGSAVSPRYTYAGVAVMSPQLLAPVKRGARAPLAPLLYSAAAEERLSGEVFTGLWQDVGTAERLAELAAQLASRT